MRQNRIHKYAWAVIVGGLALAACSGEGDSGGEIRNEDDLASTTSTKGDSPYLVSVSQRFPDCEAIGAVLGTYIEGLNPTPTSQVGPQRVQCSWDAAGGAASSGVQSVEVVITPDATTSATADKSGLVTIADPQIEAAGGFAHNMPINMAGTAVTAAGVELPEASVAITVGGRDQQAILDGPGAVAVAKQLLGL